MTYYYHIWQNNSGGVDVENEELGISGSVIFTSESNANDYSNFHDNFFNKLVELEEKSDYELELVWSCECCGDRWHEWAVTGPYSTLEEALEKHKGASIFNPGL